MAADADVLESAVLHDLVGETFYTVRALVATVIEESVESGEFTPDVNPADLVDMVLAVVQGGYEVHVVHFDIGGRTAWHSHACGWIFDSKRVLLHILLERSASASRLDAGNLYRRRRASREVIMAVADTSGAICAFHHTRSWHHYRRVQGELP